MVAMVSLVFLAGGVGGRMGTPIPKQFLAIENKLIALFSYELFSQIPEITQIVVVCEPEYQKLFPKGPFAKPGKRRQDSVYSGLLKTDQEIVLTHDSARPFVEAQYIPPLLQAIRRTGAAGLATPVMNTIKQCNSSHIVEKTLDRAHLWEMQTPQGMRRDLFFKAFNELKGREVTDEMALVEAMGLPCEVVPSSSRNFKITTPFDFAVAKTLCATN